VDQLNKKLERSKQPFRSSQRNQHCRGVAAASGFSPALGARLCFEQSLAACWSPTVCRDGECSIHVSHPDGEVMFWLSPSIELSRNIGQARQKIKDAERIVDSCQLQITDDWTNHFGS
jgi:hypothetical protein